MNFGNFGREFFILLDEVVKLYEGYEVVVYIKIYFFLDCILFEVVVEEILEDRKNLERLVGYLVKGMFYFYGVYNEEIVNILLSFGIEYVRIVNFYYDFCILLNFLIWVLICYYDDNLLEFGCKFLEYEYKGKLKLMYVWGYSFEFERKNNWYLIESFCKLMLGKDDIWYVINIEIVRYIKVL